MRLWIWVAKGFFKELSSAGFICPCSNHLDVCVLWDCLLASVQCWQYQSQSSFWKFILVSTPYASWRECYIRNGITSRLPLRKSLLLYLFEANVEAAARSSFGLGCRTKRDAGTWAGIEPWSCFCPVDLVPGTQCGHAQTSSAWARLGWLVLVIPSFTLLKSNQTVCRTKLVQEALQSCAPAVPWLSLHLRQRYLGRQFKKWL